MTLVPDLDDRRRRAAHRWGLTLGPALAGGSRSAVCAARDDAGRDLVLKLPAARTGVGDPAADEAAALRIWAGTGASVRLVDASEDALLLVRCRPGGAWPWAPADVAEAVATAAELLARLWAAPRGTRPFPTMSQAYADAERVARADARAEQQARGEPDRGRPGLERLPAAGRLAERLVAGTDRPRLLHGDAISKNLVGDDTAPTGWVLIDPQPVLGDPAAEVAAFAAYHPAGLMLPLAEELARALRLDVGRVLQWTAIWGVHQTCQAWRDDQPELEELVASTAVTALLAG